MPDTVQKKYLILIFLIALIRVSFFGLATFSWDSQKGEIKSNKVLFYSLDEFATVLFFSIVCLLTLFWAEIYYLAIDHIEEFKNRIRPITYLINVLAYFAIIICCIIASKFHSDYTNYIYAQYSIIISCIFLFGAMFFSYFTYKSSQELIQIPIPLSERKEKTRKLKSLAYIFIFSLVVRSILILIMTGKSLKTTSFISRLLASLYYLFLELIPLTVGLNYYKPETTESSYQNYFVDIEETTPLTSTLRSNKSNDEIQSLVERLSQYNSVG